MFTGTFLLRMTICCPKKPLVTGFEVLQRFVGQLLIDLGVDRDRAAGQQAERIAIRSGVLTGVGRDDRVGAGTVLDHYTCSGPGLEFLSERTNEHVDRTARRQWYDDLDRAGRIFALRQNRQARQAKHRTQANEHKRQKTTSPHETPPKIVVGFTHFYFFGCSTIPQTITQATR